MVSHVMAHDVFNRRGRGICHRKTFFFKFAELE